VKYDPNIKQIFAKAIGDVAIAYFEAQGCSQALDVAENRALEAIAQIKTILDDKTLNDPECVQRIEAVVELFHEAGISTTRHDWG